MRADPQAGLTLVEALVSLVVFSLIAAGAVFMLAQSVRSQESLMRVEANLRDLQMTQALLAADAAQIAPRSLRMPDNTRTPRFAGGLETVALGFVRAAADLDSARGAPTSVVYVEYVLRDGALIRRTRDALDPPANAAAMSERVLLQGLTGARIRFFSGADWLDVWSPGPTAGLPRAVALEADSSAYGKIRIAVLIAAS